MGLIRRQMGSDLKIKIEDWLKKSNLVLLGITDDLRLLVPNSSREILIQVILYTIKEFQGLPEYIVFDFSRCDYCTHIYHYGCIEDALQLFNKADKHLFGINKCRIYCHESERAIYDLERIDGEWRCVEEY